MSEDRELRVMESRVRTAMEKCPQGKEILVELFPEITRGEWKEVPDDEIAFRKYDSDGWNLNSCGYHFAIQLVDINSLTQDKFKFENGRIYKKI